MNDVILGFDHPVIAVRDMEAARGTYERLGFTIPPRGSHIEWGTGNWCIMFEKDYIELRGILDPDRYTHHLEEFLAEREGLMGMALATTTAKEGYEALRARRLEPAEPKDLTRNFELPEGWLKPRFRMVFLPESTAPGLMHLLLLEHLTPELIRRPEWLKHPNGVRRVRAITTVVDELDSVRPAYEKLFGEARIEHGVLTVSVGQHARINVTTPDSLERLHGPAAFDPEPTPPFLAAVSLEVESAPRVQELLKANDVPVDMPSDNLVRVGPGPQLRPSTRVPRITLRSLINTPIATIFL